MTKVSRIYKRRGEVGSRTILCNFYSKMTVVSRIYKKMSQKRSTNNNAKWDLETTGLSNPLLMHLKDDQYAFKLMCFFTFGQNLLLCFWSHLISFSQSLMASIFAALPTDPKFSPLKDLNPFKTMSKLQEPKSILKSWTFDWNDLAKQNKRAFKSLNSR